MAIQRPQLRKCDDPRRTPATPANGVPEAWLTLGALEEHGIGLLDFDFFVDWSSDPISVTPLIWVKRVRTARSVEDEPDLRDEIVAADGPEFLRLLGGFGQHHCIEVAYAVIPNNVDWVKSPGTVSFVDVEPDGSLGAVCVADITEVRDRIRTYSGGQVFVGRKGLIFGTTALECYLSHTDSAWPGDADGVLVDDDGHALAVLEFKKNTLHDDITEDTLADYYPKPDHRKYDRLAALAEYLEVPLVVVFYGSRLGAKKTRIERIEGPLGGLFATTCLVVDAPGEDKRLAATFVDAVLEATSLEEWAYPVAAEEAGSYDATEVVDVRRVRMGDE